MADTKRSLSSILALFADNTTQQISPQDLRDGVVTLAADFGTLYIVSPTATTITDTTSSFPINGTYAFSVGSGDWDMNTNGQLRYTGAATRLAIIFFTGALQSASNNQTFEIGLAKNGSLIPSSTITQRVSSTSSVETAAAFAAISVSTNDYVTGVVRNTTGPNNATFLNVKLGAVGLPN